MTNSKISRLRFRDKEYLLINGTNNRIEGAIATEEEYNNFEPCQFHLFEDGTIMSYGEIVGKIDDIEWLN